MSETPPANNASATRAGAGSVRCVLAREGLDALFAALRERGYTVIGPTRRDGAIVIDELDSASALPIGWRDLQGPGSYRLEKRNDDAFFGHVVGPHSYKRFFHVPRERLFQLRRKDKGFEAVVVDDDPAPRLALIGVRACEIAAISIQDEVLMRGANPDPRYAARRKDVLVIAVACNEPGATCFCTSMEGDPVPRGGFDLALTELLPGAGNPHRFLVETGSEAGGELLASLPTSEARQSDRDEASALAAKARGNMGLKLDTNGIKDLLYAAAEHPRWQKVAERCLTCTNCTMVCPTCFCSRVDDVTALDGETVERVRSCDSCFSLEYSHMHGGPARGSVAARYRQWLTHKLGSWIDQFGSSGCVGCGRCITWCPAGIDITEEIAAIRAEPTPPRSKRI